MSQPVARPIDEAPRRSAACPSYSRNNGGIVVVSFKRRMLVQLLASAAIASPAAAQGTPDQVAATPTSSGQTTQADVPQNSSTTDGDIIVTAQKRDENIQNVPISIQAIGTRRLDQLNVSNFNDYTQLLP